MRSLRSGALILCLVAALAACTSSGSPKQKSGGTAKSALSSRLENGIASLTSAHFAATTDYAGQKVRGSGVLRLKDGDIEAGDVTQALPGGLGTIRIVRSGGKVYAKLPAGLATTTKPWLLITPDSKNPIVSQLSSLIGTVLGIAAPSSLTAFVAAAKSVDDKGSVSVAGTRTTHYALQVDPTKLPDALQNSVGSGTSLPVDLWIDTSGRPVQVSGTFTLIGQKITPTIQLSAFGRPVTVTPPPASDVGTS